MLFFVVGYDECVCTSCEFLNLWGIVTRKLFSFPLSSDCIAKKLRVNVVSHAMFAHWNKNAEVKSSQGNDVRGVPAFSREFSTIPTYCTPLSCCVTFSSCFIVLFIFIRAKIMKLKQNKYSCVWVSRANSMQYCREEVSLLLVAPLQSKIIQYTPSYHNMGLMWNTIKLSFFLIGWHSCNRIISNNLKKW